MKSHDIGDMARQLATAVRKWAEVDSNVADVGWTRTNEGKWDDCRCEMINLADEVLAMGKGNGGKRRSLGVSKKRGKA